MTMQHRLCEPCDFEFDVLTLRGVSWAIDHPLLSDTSLTKDQRDKLIELGVVMCCPRCNGTQLRSIIKAGVGIELGGEAGVGRIYPYFDRGLGCHVHSAAHRRQLMAARGLVDAGDEDIVGMYEQIESADDANAAEFARENEEIMSDGETRRANDLIKRILSDGGKTPQEQREHLNKHLKVVESVFGSTSVDGR